MFVAITASQRGTRRLPFANAFAERLAPGGVTSRFVAIVCVHTRGGKRKCCEKEELHHDVSCWCGVATKKKGSWWAICGVLVLWEIGEIVELEMGSAGWDGQRGWSTVLFRQVST